jgi:ribonuclease-3
MKANLSELEEQLDYTFKSTRLFTQAMTHSSIKDDEHPSNERLEFLGDAVLGLVVTEYIYKVYPDFDEGELTAIKSVVVSHESLLKIARKLKLKKYISVGKGITKKRTVPASLIANAVEAFIGALYLDGGYRAARKFVLPHIEPLIIKASKKSAGKNFKSLLQNYVQKKFGSTPHYRLVTENGPDHKKVFELEAVVCERTFPPGAGKTKKIASQQAARHALRILQNEYGKLPNSSR